MKTMYVFSSNLAEKHTKMYVFSQTELTLLYTIVPIGVGGHFFNVILFCSKIGRRDQDFKDK